MHFIFCCIYISSKVEEVYDEHYDEAHKAYSSKEDIASFSLFSLTQFLMLRKRAMFY